MQNAECGMNGKRIRGESPVPLRISDPPPPRASAVALWAMAGRRCFGEVRREALEKALKPLRAGAWGEDSNFRRGRRRRKFLPHKEL
jgi:hypothetical protein